MFRSSFFYVRWQGRRSGGTATQKEFCDGEASIVYGGLIQLPYILASVVGGCSQNPVLLVAAAPQLRWAVFRDGVWGSKQV